MADVEIKFPKEDVREIFRAMERARKELSNTWGGAIRMAGITLSQSMGTSTRVSPKTRPFKILQKRSARGGKPATMLVEWEKESRSGKKTQQGIIEGTGVRDAKKHPFIRIGMQGLAKSSWKWAAKAARTPGAVKLPAKEVARSAREWGIRYSEGGSRFRGDDPYYRITNKLPYIEDALHGGANAPETAMRRAADGLNHWIDNEVKRRFGAK
jgi:hypothetical protein